MTKSEFVRMRLDLLESFYIASVVVSLFRLEVSGNDDVQCNLTKCELDDGFFSRIIYKKVPTQKVKVLPSFLLL